MSTIYVTCPSCGSDVKAEVEADSEGDFGVIGGIHNFTAVEDLDRSECEPECEATEDELRDLLAERYNEPFDPADDPAFPW